MIRDICIVSPGHLSTNPRLVKEALALQEAGYRVRVMHGRFSRWGTQEDATIAPRLAEVTAVPFGATEASLPKYLAQGLSTRLARGLVGRGVSAPSLIEAAHGPMVRDLVRAVCARPADLYVAHYVAALPAAARAARRHGRVFAFDAEDFHPGDLPDGPEHRAARRIVEAIEARYLGEAAYVTAASPMIASAYAAAYSIPLPTVVLNVFPKGNGPAAPTPRGAARPSPSVYWFSQTIGQGRGLELLVEAAGRARSEPHLHIRGTAAPGYAEHLQDLARQAGAGDRLHFLDRAPPDEMERLGAGYDLGYVGEIGNTENRKICLTNKLFSYLLGGVPVIASDIPAHRDIAPKLVPAISLFPIDDAGALAAEIDRFLLDSDLLARAREHAWTLGQERFNWEIEKEALLTAVEQAGAAPARR